ncbi:MAG: hypothetical protein ACKOAF_08135 [Actinomycetes bacterium]
MKTKALSGDVYVETQSGKKWIHLSLHESGQWHFGVTREGRKRAQDTSLRQLATTVSRPELAPGWLHGMRLVVARSELLPSFAKVEGVIDVPIPSDYPAVAIDLFILDPNHPEAAPIRAHEAFPIAEVQLGDGRIICLVALPMLIPEPPSVAFALEKKQAMADLKSQGWDGAPTAIVIFADADPDAGYMFQAEVAVSDQR